MVEVAHAFRCGARVLRPGDAGGRDLVDVRMKPRGFAAMTPEQREAISRLGGKAASGKAHAWTRQQAIAASRKGVEARRRKKLEREKAMGISDEPGYSDE